MPATSRRRLRRLRRGIGYAAALMLVAVALLIAIASRLLPMAERNPEKVAAWLSERAGRPVRFAGVQTEWTRRGPLLRLRDLRIGAIDNPLRVGDAELQVSQFSGLLPGRSFTELRLRGLQLTLERDAQGQWRVHGLPGQQQTDGDPLSELQRLGELQVVGGKLRVLAPSLGIDAGLLRVDVRVQAEDDMVRAGVRAWVGNETTPLRASMQLDRKRGDGRMFFDARKVDLAAWSNLLHFGGVELRGGDGDLRLWLRLQAHRVQQVSVDAELKQLRLLGAPIAGMSQPPSTELSQLDARATWSLLPGGWRLDAPRLRIDANTQRNDYDGAAVAVQRGIAARIPQARIGPLLQLLALSDRIEPAARRWIVAAQPDAMLRNVTIGGRQQAMRGQLQDASFRAVGNAPGMRGVSGDLIGDASAVALQFDPAANMVFDWPSGFGVAHPFTARGDVSAWRDGAGWQVATPGLRIRGADYGVAVRGGLQWQGDGTLPRIDLAADVDDAPVPASHKFWVHYLMPPASVQWLNSALLGGRVHEGRAVVSGDLDDWPFTDRNGLFRAQARVQDATVKFQPDWPAAQHIDGEVDFVGSGFTARGSGSLAGVKIDHFDAGIENFAHADLEIAANGGGDAAQLLQMLRQSPLQKTYGDTLDHITARGPTQVTFELDLPLHEHLPIAKLGGNVQLSGARLTEQRWKLDFDNVRGSARYDHRGFAAEQLRVVHQGQAGLLNLRAGEHVRDRTHAFEGELEVQLDAHVLLDRVGELDWLRARVSGRSPWSIGVVMPLSVRGTQPATLLQLKSSLAGTRIDLPEPLAKAAANSMPISIETALPYGAGDLNVSFGNALALRTRTVQGRGSGMRVQLGSAHVIDAPPDAGLIVAGRADRFDPIAWMGLLRGNGNASASSGMSDLRRLDVTAGRLMLGTQGFADTRMIVVPASGGMAVQLEGNTLQGALMVPRADAATIAGKFARLHLPMPGTSGNPQASAAAPTSSKNVADDIDPAKVPPLNLVIDSLRIGNAALGRTQLRTQPSANGMRIVQLQADGERQRIAADGDWIARGSQQSTRVNLRVDSSNYGAVLNGFGLGGQLAGGKGSLQLQAQWPGAPTDVRLDALNGQLAVDVHDGQLVEVEPGAGRVLGLFGLSQLPRRLALDFRDFFDKGFAFDHLRGQVRLGNGAARTDDLTITGPAAEIHIRGAANLRNRTYDQTIDVIPRTGNLLTVAGALAGGPIGAAIGAAANAVLKKPLGQMAAKTYRVTGPWKTPKVEVSGKQTDSSRPAPAPDG